MPQLSLNQCLSSMWKRSNVIQSIPAGIFFLLLMTLVFSSGCATSLVALQTDLQEPKPNKAIVVGSFLIEPVPEWQNPADHYWISVWRGGREYIIELNPGNEKSVVMQLRQGSYNIARIYEGKQGLWSRGHGRAGAINSRLEFDEGDIYYIGRIRIVIAREPSHLYYFRRQESQRRSRTISQAVFGTSYSGRPTRPIMYTDTLMEDDFDTAVKMLKQKGWSEATIKNINKSLIPLEEDD